VLNASAITLALLTKLQTDAPLLALLPDGTWYAEAPPGLQRFVIVSLISCVDEPLFGGVAFKDALYLVEARALSTSGGDVYAAFARIATLLTDAGLTLTGYAPMLMRFEEETDLVEVDAADASIRWHRCGGHLHVMVAPLVS